MSQAIRSYIILFLTILLSKSIQSQDLEDFDGLHAQNPVPLDLTISTSKKSRTAIKENKNTALGKDFFIDTRFFVDELLSSGKILFNDAVTDYISNVGSNLLIKNEELKDHLRFYTIKTNIVNAFSTDEGIIFVTTGLISRLENEAQLAFILSHEICHFLEGHVRKGYIHRRELESSTGKIRKFEYDDALRTISQYSQKNEFEADSSGLALFLESDYDPAAIQDAFQLLKNSEYSLGEQAVNQTFLSYRSLVIPSEFFNFDTTIQKTYKKHDELSTHPAVEDRIYNLTPGISSSKRFNKSLFVQSEDEFSRIKDLCRFESIKISIGNGKYLAALYDCHLLSQSYPNNQYLSLSKAKSLYGIMKYFNHERKDELYYDEPIMSDPLYSAYTLFDGLSKNAINIIALHSFLEYEERFGKTPLTQEYLFDIKHELVFNTAIDLDKLESSTASNSINKDSATEFYYYPLADFTSSSFSVEELKGIVKSTSKTSHGSRDDFNIQVMDSLNVDTLVVIDPAFSSYNLKKNKRHVRSEITKKKIAEFYLSSYREIDLEISLIDSKTLEVEDSEKYNELDQVYNWLFEELSHNGIEMINSNQHHLDVIKSKYGTSKLYFSGVFTYQDFHKFGLKHIAMIGFMYTAPLALIDLITPHNYFDYIAFVIDSESGEIEFFQIYNAEQKGTASIVRGYMYEALYDLSH